MWKYGCPYPEAPAGQGGSCPSLAFVSGWIWNPLNSVSYTGHRFGVMVTQRRQILCVLPGGAGTKSRCLCEDVCVSVCVHTCTHTN